MNQMQIPGSGPIQGQRGRAKNEVNVNGVEYPSKSFYDGVPPAVRTAAQAIALQLIKKHPDAEIKVHVEPSKRHLINENSKYEIHIAAQETTAGGEKESALTRGDMSWVAGHTKNIGGIAETLGDFATAKNAIIVHTNIKIPFEV